MTIKNQGFEMWSGDTKVLTITVTDKDGVRVNLTGATIVYKIFDGGTAVITKSTANGITITDASGGECQTTLSPSDTSDLDGVYYHECQVTDSSGNVSTIFTGAVTIQGEMI